MWHKFKLNGSTSVRPAKIHPDSPDAVDCPSVALASSAAASLAAASPSSLYLAQLRFVMRSTMKPMKWSRTTTERKPKTVTYVLILIRVYMFTYVYTLRVHVYVYVFLFFSLRILCLHSQQCHNCHSSSYHFRCAMAAMLFPHPTWHQVLDRTPTAAISAREAERRAAVLAATGPLDAPRRNQKWFITLKLITPLWLGIPRYPIYICIYMIICHMCMYIYIHITWYNYHSMVVWNTY